jgi:hypothetical protein
MVQALEEKEAFFPNFKSILGAVLKDPTLWTKPNFRQLRDFTTTIISNPQMFTHALPDSLEKKKLDSPSEHPPFSKGIAKSLYARESISDPELIVVVVALSQKFRSFDIENRTQIHYGLFAVSRLPFRHLATTLLGSKGNPPRLRISCNWLTSSHDPAWRLSGRCNKRCQTALLPSRSAMV